MAAPNPPYRSKFKHNFLYWGIFIYLVSIIAIQPGSGNPDQFRIPGFALLLLILVQVIFPNFRFSKLSNFLAVFIILATTLILSNFPLR